MGRASPRAVLSRCGEVAGQCPPTLFGSHCDHKPMRGLWKATPNILRETSLNRKLGVGYRHTAHERLLGVAMSIEPRRRQGTRPIPAAISQREIAVGMGLRSGITAL